MDAFWGSVFEDKWCLAVFLCNLKKKWLYFDVVLYNDYYTFYKHILLYTIKNKDREKLLVMSKEFGYSRRMNDSFKELSN